MIEPLYLAATPDTFTPFDGPAVHCWVSLDRRGNLIAEIQCPICGDRHTHGAGTPDRPVFGPRTAHCSTGPGGSYHLIGPGLDQRPMAFTAAQKTRRLLADDAARGIARYPRQPRPRR